LLAGIVSASINLLLLGSMLTQAEATPGDAAASSRPQAPLIVTGFVGASVAMTTAAGWIAGRWPQRGPSPAGSWLGRFGLVTALSMVPLLAAGGAVTSSGAGLSVPDWPGTYGWNMFLYPVGLMADPYIFLEHTHRLFGTLVGLTVLALMAAVLMARVGLAAKVGCVVLFVGVGVQGVLGGIRVVDINPAFGAVHGVLAQILLAGAAVLAAALSTAWRESGPQPEEIRLASRRVLKVSGWAIGTLLIQLTLGALWRHTFMVHALWSHLGFSMVAALAVAVLGFMLTSVGTPTPASRKLRGLGSGLIAALLLQIVLGFAAWIVIGDGTENRVLTPDELSSAEGPDTPRTLLATAHQLNGAGLLAMTCLASAWAWRARGPRTGNIPPAGVLG
jgi:cytochrome c oxidase assembly protein subunit 15